MDSLFHIVKEEPVDDDLSVHHQNSSGAPDDRMDVSDDGIIRNRSLPKTWCHQCKMRKQKVTACDNFFSTDKEVRCNGRYCDACIQRHYMENPAQFATLPQWICYRCTGRCTCAACKRRRKADEDLEERGAEPEPRKRDLPRRFFDDARVEDDDFEPKKRAAYERSEQRSVPQAPRVEKRQQHHHHHHSHTNNNNGVVNTAGMSALALLAEESLTLDFVPQTESSNVVVLPTSPSSLSSGSVVVGASSTPSSSTVDMVLAMQQQASEILQLKQFCSQLQLQVQHLTMQMQQMAQYSNKSSSSSSSLIGTDGHCSNASSASVSPSRSEGDLSVVVAVPVQAEPFIWNNGAPAISESLVNLSVNSATIH